MAWETEPGADSRGREQNGEPERLTVEEDERFVDHHIEEVLDALSDAARAREDGLGIDPDHIVPPMS